MRTWAPGRVGWLLVWLCFACSSIALANDVNLELRTGGFNISGELLSYDGKSYVISSKTLGTLTISAEKFRCTSGDCPIGAIGDAVSADDNVLRIIGSTTMGYELLPALIKKYADNKNIKVGEIGDGPEAKIELLDGKGNPAGRIELQRQGSDAAFAALLKSGVVIGMSAKQITDAQIGQFVRAGYFDMDKIGHQHVIGLDSLLIVISPQNPLSVLSLEDISRIFSGEVNNWSEFGGDNQPIHVYSRVSEAGISSVFRDLVLKPYKRTITGAASAYHSNAEVAEAVAADSGGIGFVSFAELNIAKPIGLKDTCGIIHQPTPFFVKSGEYPLSRTFYLYTTEITQPNIADFVGFSVSSDGQKTVEQAGFINRQITTASFPDFYDRIIASMAAQDSDFNLDLLYQFMHELNAGQRLSATIHFEQSGGTEIDAESSQQLFSIINFITEQDLSRYKVLLAGFSDATGSSASNAVISLKRAEAVRRALLALSRSSFKPGDIVTKGYGKFFPVMCNDTKGARRKNRRVEVWLVPRHTKPIALKRQP